jgi:hypothetical protein
MTTNVNNELPNIVKLESLAQKETKQKHQREIELFADTINLFTSGFNYMGTFETKDDNEAEYIWLLLITRCLHSLRCSINLMLKGYYSQAMALLRIGTEDWFICGTCQENDKVRNYLLRGKGEKPSYSSLAKDMGEKKVYKWDYSFQSKFIHSSKLSLAVLYDINTKRLNVAPIYDKNLFLLCAESLFRVSLKMAQYMWHTLFYLDKDKAKSWDKENGQRVKNIANWLNELREQYGKEASHARSQS